MGCVSSKPTTVEINKVSPDKEFPSSPVKVQIHEVKQYTSMIESKVTNIKELKINTADLVTEKTGRINQEYKFLNELGSGAFGKVQRAIHLRTSIIRAIKIINKESAAPEEQSKLINEVNILKNLDHPNIMKILEFYQDESYFYIVSEFYNGGELFDRIFEYKSFSEKDAALTMKQILSAIFYCHQNKIVHRDLKPENILFESKAKDALLKVIDFGTSAIIDPNKKLNQKYGTAYYIAPEVIRRKYNEKCDIWSCGVILYILLCGFPPFNGQNDKQIMEKVALGKYDFHHEEWRGISEEAKRFIRKMLEIDVDLRYSAEQALNDQWIKRMASNAEIDKPIAFTALKNLRTFRAERKLQEATWVFLVTYMSTKEEKAELLKTFQALDLNGDGQLTRDELLIGYQKIMGEGKAEEEVNEIMRQVDVNGSGAIDYTEFVMATINRQKLLSKDRLEAAFKIFDKDGNGYLEIDEIKAIFNPGGQKDISEQVWLDIIKEVDPNSDGKISLVEFKEMMIKII